MIAIFFGLISILLIFTYPRLFLPLIGLSVLGGVLFIVAISNNINNADTKRSVKKQNAATEYNQLWKSHFDSAIKNTNNGKIWATGLGTSPTGKEIINVAYITSLNTNCILELTYNPMISIPAMAIKCHKSEIWLSNLNINIKLDNIPIATQIQMKAPKEYFGIYDADTWYQGKLQAFYNSLRKNNIVAFEIKEGTWARFSLTGSNEAITKLQPYMYIGQKSEVSCGPQKIKHLLYAGCK